MTPEFLLTAFIVCVTPGIGVVYTLSVVLGAAPVMGWMRRDFAALGLRLAMERAA